MTFKSIAKMVWAGLIVGQFLGCSTNAEKGSVAKVPALNITAALPAVAASYSTTRTLGARAADAHQHSHAATAPANVATDWRFYREANRIEVEDLKTHTGEIWELDGRTQFFFKLFHNDARGIEYREEDLQILEVTASWQRHGLLIAPEVLHSLATVHAGWRDGYPYRQLQGTVEGKQLEVIWRLDLNIPVLIKSEVAGLQEVTELKEIYPLAQAPWPRRNVMNYTMIDYADLGDYERDPFVLRVQNLLPGGHVHRH